MSELDSTDREILKLLEGNARDSVEALAEELRHVLSTEISTSAVRRRIARLEKEKFIVKYTAVIDHEKVSRSVEAFVELTLDGEADAQAVLAEALKEREVREVAVLAGEPDAMVRLRVDRPVQLRKVVTKLRKLQGVNDSKTLVALGRERRASKFAEE